VRVILWAVSVNFGDLGDFIGTCKAIFNRKSVALIG